MKITVITVCYNEEDYIRDTIKSVLVQNSLEYEYIICDGGSTDSTLEIAESFKTQFRAKGINYLISSERDGGVYFGMNKGIKMAEGDYLNFLNAGDQYNNSNVLDTVISEIDKKKADIIFGDIVFVERGYGKLITGDEGLLNEGMSICHQSMFIKATLMKEQPYNTNYRIVSDYDFTLRMKKAGKIFYHIDAVIANYRSGGLSTTQVDQIAKEYTDIKRNMGLPYNYKLALKNAKKNLMVDEIKNKIPYCIWSIYNKMKRRTEY